MHGQQNIIILCVSICNLNARNAHPPSIFKECCILTCALMDKVNIFCTRELMNVEFVWLAFVLVVWRCGLETRLA